MNFVELEQSNQRQRHQAVREESIVVLNKVMTKILELLMSGEGHV